MKKGLTILAAFLLLAGLSVQASAGPPLGYWTLG